MSNCEKCLNYAEGQGGYYICQRFSVGELDELGIWDLLDDNNCPFKEE